MAIYLNDVAATAAAATARADDEFTRWKNVYKFVDFHFATNL